MLVFAILIIAVCIGVILKANQVLTESELSEPEPEYSDWEFPPRWTETSRTEEH